MHYGCDMETQTPMNLHSSKSTCPGFVVVGFFLHIRQYSDIKKIHYMTDKETINTHAHVNGRMKERTEARLNHIL